MSTPSDRPNIPPALADLLGRYLQEQASAHVAGLAFADTTGDVIPHEAVAAQTTDPRLAWDGACAAIRYLMPKEDLRSFTPPADWPMLVADQESVTFLPLCIGNFPQQVRELGGLTHALPLAAPVRSGHSSSAPAGLLTWAEKASWEKGQSNPLLAAAALRLAGEFDRAAEVLNRSQKRMPKPWQAAWANETAALAWHRGQLEEAERLWQKQSESAAVLFNRGLAALTAGRNKEARTLLGKAVAQMPESDGWHHLGQVYVALAEMAA